MADSPVYSWATSVPEIVQGFVTVDVTAAAVLKGEEAPPGTVISDRAPEPGEPMVARSGLLNVVCASIPIISPTHSKI